MLLTTAKIEPKSYESRENSNFYLGRTRLILTCLTRHYVASTALLAPVRVQELCESRGGRPGLPVLMILTVSVDV